MFVNSDFSDRLRLMDGNNGLAALKRTKDLRDILNF